jgi:outer membrane immunogenic protein
MHGGIHHEKSTIRQSAGIEYDHLFMGNSNNSFSVANPIVAGALNRISQDVDMVTLRVNYRFGGPAVARY